MKKIILALVVCCIQTLAYSQEHVSFKCSLVVKDENGQMIGEKMGIVPDETTELSISGHHLFYGDLSVNGNPEHQYLHIGLLDYLDRGVLFLVDDEAGNFSQNADDSKHHTSATLTCTTYKN